MATVNEIIRKCKEGSVLEAYDIAKADLEARPSDIWVQREMGWAIYYQIKELVIKRDFRNLIRKLDELNALNLLISAEEQMIFDNVLFQLAGYIKNNVYITDAESLMRLSEIYTKIKCFDFNPSKGYSYLLQVILKIDTWNEFADFIEWWNLDKLTPEDYKPFVTDTGREIMTLAERVHIAYAKALLKKTGNSERIRSFLPKLDNLIEAHPEMMYPGYFYGKLLLALGSDVDDALKVMLPFARKKSSEFWVWQLLAEAYHTQPDIQKACLLRAVRCKTKESFLGKVRIKLTALYIKECQFAKAKYHIDKVVNCYAQNKWRLPDEILIWMHQPWMKAVEADEHEQSDYMNVTNDILCRDTDECLAIVTYVDSDRKRMALVYGYQKKMMQKLRNKIKVGTVLKINIVTDLGGRDNVVNMKKAELPKGLSYAKEVEGIIDKREANSFAFLKTPDGKYFITPDVVNRYKLLNQERARSIVVYDYDKKKNTWNWRCVTIVK